MGTRSAAKIKLRATLFKCDVCGRRLMSAEALKSHQEGVHNATAKVKTKVPIKSPLTKPKHQTPKIKNLKLAKIGIGKPKSVTQKKATITPKSAAKTKSPPKATPISTTSNVHFECPKCFKTFAIYFSAHRHIQKCHCVNSEGEKVLPNSPDLIKPVKRNLCPRCNKQIMAEESHICVNSKLAQDSVDPSWFYICAGCKQQFNSLKLFDLHVSGLHYKGVESMFFPSKEEFQEWKIEMEKLSKVRYSILGQSTFKEMYRCTFLPDGGSECDDRTSIVCPSTIVVQEFSKGVQVHFYKDHHEHKFQKYSLPDKYKKFSLTTLLQNAEGYTQTNEMKADESGLYLQFKKLLEFIMADSAKINVETLKVLIAKALDMTRVLNSYDEDPDSDSFSSKKAGDFNISWPLGNDSAAEKRKVDINEHKATEPITKRFKTRLHQYNPNESIDGNASIHLNTLQDSTIKIINSFSLADKDISKVVNEMDSESDTHSKSSKKEVGRNSTSPLLGEDDKDNLMTPIKTKKKSVDNSSPTSFNDSYKDFVSKNFKITHKSKSKTKAVAPMSRNSQSKPVSPKAHVPKESKTMSPFQSLAPAKRKSSDTPFSKPVDIKYEVKERENDCNILILKI